MNGVTVTAQSGQVNVIPTQAMHNSTALKSCLLPDVYCPAREDNCPVQQDPDIVPDRIKVITLSGLTFIDRL